MILKAKTFFPQECVFCSKYPCSDDFPICHKCLRHFHNLLNEKCIKCGNTPSRCICSETEKIRFAFYFNQLRSRKLIYDFKHDTDKRTVDFLGEILIRNCGLNPESFDGVTYVPRIRRNIKRYGYDQSKLLAKSISKIYGIPFVTALKVKKRKRDKEQKLLTIAQRKKNALEKYELAFIPNEKYKRILLVDDITTTGATVNACARLLRKDFAKIVTVAVLAKTNTFVK